MASPFLFWHDYRIDHYACLQFNLVERGKYLVFITVCYRWLVYEYQQVYV